MRRPAVLALLASAAVLAPAAPALAHPGVALDPASPLDVTVSSTDNVEHLGRFPEHAGTAGGAPSADGTTFLLTDPRGVHAYDTTDAAKPVLLDSVALYQTTTGAALAQEDPDTDGTILLVDAATTPAAVSSRLQVVDVSDPRDLKVVSSLPVVDHTWTCVTGVVDAATGATRGCAFAYGRTGHIVDLRDPAAPVLLPQTWRAAVGYGNRTNAPYTHDLTEVRPGLVMTAGASAVVMDTTDPTKPVYLTVIGQRDRFSSLGYHSVEWAREGRDRFVVLGTEIAPPALPQLPAAAGNTAGSDCQGEAAVIETWDASGFLTAWEAYQLGRDPAVFHGELFRKVDSYDASGRGLFLDGKAPGSELYCAHWMETHPQFKNGGLLAVAYYNRGTRFVQVGRDGVMTEVGWITPAESYTGSPQWVTDEIVYVMDYRRGLEVVRLVPDATATKVKKTKKDSVNEQSAFAVPAGSGPGPEQLAWAALALLGLGLVKAERAVRRREWALATA
jgi:hypothetical protein